MRSNIYTYPHPELQCVTLLCIYLTKNMIRSLFVCWHWYQGFPVHVSFIKKREQNDYRFEAFCLSVITCISSLILLPRIPGILFFTDKGLKWHTWSLLSCKDPMKMFLSTKYPKSTQVNTGFIFCVLFFQLIAAVLSSRTNRR